MGVDKSVDKTDLKILNLMLEKPEVKYKDLAKSLGLTIGTVHNRIKAMKANKVIQQIVPDIDTKKLGYDITALINVLVKGGHLEVIEKKYSKHRNVSAVYDVTGNYDMLIVGKFRNTDDLNKFVKGLMAEEYVERTNTSLVLNIVKGVSAPFPLG